MGMLQIIAHRGYSSRNPENTIASFDDALDSGCPYIELDVHLTADGIPVVMHDFTVERTTDGSGSIASKSLAEMKALNAGSWFGPEHQSELVPTLEEILQRYAGRAHIFVELKSDERQVLIAMRELLLKHLWIDPAAGDQDHSELPVPGISVISFVAEQVVAAREILPELTMHGLLVIQPTQDAIEFCLQHGIQGFLPYFGALDPNIVAAAQRAGLYVGAWGLEEPEQLASALSLGISGVTVNWPTEALEKLAQLT